MFKQTLQTLQVILMDFMFEQAESRDMLQPMGPPPVERRG